VATQMSVTMPQSTESKEQRHIDKLQGLSGPDFDKAYIRLMVQDHRKDVAHFKHAADRADNPELRQFASRTLPILQEHLRQAESIAQTLGVSVEGKSENEHGMK
jgi:putative membrane protein